MKLGIDFLSLFIPKPFSMIEVYYEPNVVIDVLRGNHSFYADQQNGGIPTSFQSDPLGLDE